MAVSTVGFDESSGLQFSETTVSARVPPCSCDAGTSRHLPRASGKSGSIGARTLARAVTTKLLRNLDLLDGASLSTLPRILLERLWKAISKAHLSTLRLWKLFADTDFGDGMFTKTWLVECKRHRLPDLLKAAATTSTSWVTDLTLSNSDYDAQELTCVASLSNLRNVHILGASAHRSARFTFDDRVLKTWAQAALEKRGFQVLEMIFIDGHQATTAWALSSLRFFPALQTFCANDCGFEASDWEIKEAQRLGWPLAKKYALYPAIPSGTDLVQWPFPALRETIHPRQHRH